MPDTVFSAFAATAAAHPAAPFLGTPGGTDLSYGAAARRVDALRTAYRAAGYGHGHRAALLLETTPEHFLHVLALNALGVAVVPVNPDYRHDELHYLLDHSEADIAIAWPRWHDALRAAGAPAAMGPDDAPPPVRRAAESGSPGHDTMAGLYYTSGTTGRPKGCILTNLYWLNAGAWYRDLGGLCAVRHGEERFYNPLPLYHMNHGIITFMCAVLSANCLILTERFSPKRWWPEIAESGATIVHYLGVVPPLLLNQPPCAEETRHRVRFGLGAGIEPQLHGAFEARFGFPLVEIWGMTETGRITAVNHEPREIDTRAFGRAVNGLAARVVDDAGAEVAAGQEGELLVRWSGPEGARHGFFAGYLKDDAATREAWRGDWFHTGDAVRQSPDGMLYFIDRRKNIIRRSGENIAAAEVEAALQAHPEVAQVAVLAVADEIREEEVLACVVPMPGVVPGRDLAERLMKHALHSLAYFKAPGWWLFLDTLPATGTQKVQKHRIVPKGDDARQRPGIVDLRGMKRR